MLLADLACEDENFESALPDYERALDLLTGPKKVLCALIPIAWVQMAGYDASLECTTHCGRSQPWSLRA